MFKVGIGYDIHRLTSGRKLILGGVDIPFEKGLFAHSDGDVLAHAICDALLGAAGLADIGTQFPDTELQYKDISSLKLLEKVRIRIRNSAYRIGNIDSVLIADRPKISGYRDRMIKNISSALGISPDLVNVKATTSEGVGQIGSQAIASYAVVLIENIGKSELTQGKKLKR